jgi:hypothetical protein
MKSMLINTLVLIFMASGASLNAAVITAGPGTLDGTSITYSWATNLGSTGAANDGASTTDGDIQTGSQLFWSSTLTFSSAVNLTIKAVPLRMRQVLGMCSSITNSFLDRQLAIPTSLQGTRAHGY